MAKLHPMCMEITEELYRRLGELFAEAELTVREARPMVDPRHQRRDRPCCALCVVRAGCEVAASRWWNDVDQRYELGLVAPVDDADTCQLLADVIALLEAHGARMLEKTHS